MPVTPPDVPTKSYAARGLLLLSGVAFIAYPALRPYGPEAGPQGAADLASTAWLISHALGMAGFITLAAALRIASTAPPWPRTGRSLRSAETYAWLAAALLLPYYGAETFALNEVARHAHEYDRWETLEIADAFRYAPLAMAVFGIGLLLLLPVAGRLVVSLWHAGLAARTGAVLAAVGLATYLPQFFGPAEVRIAHGVVLGAGLALLAISGQTHSSQARSEAGRVHVSDRLHRDHRVDT